ncbi:uncharacterized protein MONBRDRAFT_16647 [Monosiga brevicollis MX1]|uniref:alpha-1,2-Mannosidase n=1 Tax=Monosiga brevicollis TaxID=81824 RepID=A9UY58_MONBE|nr:uncharacterized protein MONBRDRAFT_16647 [Monosiga brevicollis MX1]EDQ89803.1 predicted protein [Monosiga brevicollis MX1]|eukprot:XP_001745225.1 hypothetical protein [Monosiga brevicollis MX1]
MAHLDFAEHLGVHSESDDHINGPGDVSQQGHFQPPPADGERDLAEQKRKERERMEAAIRQELNNAHQNAPPAPPAPPVPQGHPIIGELKGQSYRTEQSESRRESIKEMMRTAWSGYAKYAMGENELMPKAKHGHSASIFGRTKMGATVIDALDTLLIMGLNEEYADGRAWVADNLHFDVSASVSVFEICIRFMGGLLTAYAMTNDEMYKEKAIDLGKRLVPAFNTQTGIPKATVNLQTGTSHNWGWASGGCSILSEFGTMQLEFEYLSIISGDPTYAHKVRKVMDYVTAKERPSNGLYPNYLNPDTGRWGANEVSIGALGDSFYEYLVKQWVFEGGRNRRTSEGREAFDDAMKGVRNVLTQKSSSGLTYVAEAKGTRLVHKMGHLACFASGMFSLGIEAAPSQEWADWYLDTAAGVANTCHEGYIRTPIHIGPEAMLFDGRHEASNSNPGERYYILRPETIEAYFYMWRRTHDQKYRDWAWDAAQSIEKYCRCGVGYCGIKDVQAAHPQQDDVQQSFFLAETLKYLYLIFEDDNVISLDEWVFNTEAHPVPIQKDRSSLAP